MKLEPEELQNVLREQRLVRGFGRRSHAVRGGLPGAAEDRAGSALLIVLSFIVILAIVFAAFLASSQRALQESESSAAILKTQLLGRVALAAVLNDLAAEMRAGADGNPAVGERMEVSQPWAMVPGRVLKTDAMLTDWNFANLVKQSASGKAFFPGDNPATFAGTGAARASGASTLEPSRNQRIISAERWSRPKLLGGAGGIVDFSDDQVPDWILITRAGVVEDGAAAADVGDRDTANEDYILGRFAYNIYRVDGLLDINVAGFDPTTANAASAALSKGSLAWADLRALPGLNNSASVRAIIDWRNKESRSDYAAMVAGLRPGAPPDSTPERWGEPGGFLESFTDGVLTDNRFFSRQDLLRFFESVFGEGATEENALPFFTTFSADLNQPSFRPDPDRPRVQRSADAGGNDAFGDEDTTPIERQINPPVLEVRDAAGDPLVRRRFPLDRLQYVFPNPSHPDKVAEFFGLTWNAAEQAWNYVDGDSIRRLHQISGREPNMIELLKAAIIAGSLGGQFVDVLREPLGSPRLPGMRDASVNFHVMRIAAAIIDQYDADSFPTRIRFGADIAFGVENIPYLYGLRILPYRQTELNKITDVDPAFPVPPSAGGPLHRSVVMIQPLLWNPHSPENPSPAGERPTRFRITARSGPDVRPVARRVWWVPGSSQYFSNWPSATGDPRDAGTPVEFDPDGDYMTFSVSTDDTAPASFREPYTLKSPDYPPGSQSRSFTGGSEFSEPTLGPGEQNDPDNPEELDNRTIGFRAGWSWGGPWQGNDLYLQEGLVQSNGIDFELQYESPTGEWITFDAHEKFTNGIAPYRLDRRNHGANFINPRYVRYFLRADPRVDRYGARISLIVPTTANNGFPQGQSLRPLADEGRLTQAGWPGDMTQFNFTKLSNHWGLMSENLPVSSVRYGDPDGINRIAMGGFSDGVEGLPMALGNFNSRPVVLNRPFRSVAELGHVLRDQPWKQLDFFSPESGDAALLDVFCIHEPENPDAAPVVAGRINLNTPHPEVIEAALRGVELSDGTTLGNARVRELAVALVDRTHSFAADKGPLRNRSELVGKLVADTTYSGFTEDIGNALLGADRAIPLRRQNLLRGLVDAGTTRSWAFLIDLIVQNGQFVGTGSGPGDFLVRGEKRYWIHVAMDRFTGEVIAEQIEEVYE